MSKLPTNPTKSEISERYWSEFLQLIASAKEYGLESGTPMPLPNELIGNVNKHGFEFAFWWWYVSHKINRETK